MTNAVIGGSRWRCASCENFLSWKDLEFCTLTSEILGKFKDEATTSRDRVEYRSDNCYVLLDETGGRFNKKRKRLDESRLMDGDEAVKVQALQGVIELL